MTSRALVKDIGYGLSKLGELRRFWRAAVVTDQRWVRWIASLEGALFPIEVRAFALADKDVAMAWASEGPVPETNAT
jgi:SpoIIAA-like